ncbi:hypothetical protein F2Q70_00005684 [Brassica cretica]|uniref:Uncharacterized protein n=1 Tax=Brassica cretica TaxID=69181 RepID=A0A8S9IUR4_BRACR|nr:hypothetical protein F2Q70_00005684 [Brassica cretica]
MSQETARPVRNKLAPAMLEPSRRGTATRTSPFYTRERDAHMGRHDPKEHGDYIAAKMSVGTERVWREKQKLHHSPGPIYILLTPKHQFKKLRTLSLSQ